MCKFSYYNRFLWLALVVMLTLNLGAAFAQDKSSTTYRCIGRTPSVSCKTAPSIS